MACWANFFAEEPLDAHRWANFFAEMLLKGPCWANFFAEEPLKARCRANFFAGQQSRGPVGRVWRLDGGCVPPLDLGRVTDTKSRMHFPSWVPEGASGRRYASAFPQDSSRFAKIGFDPYI